METAKSISLRSPRTSADSSTPSLPGTTSGPPAPVTNRIGTSSSDDGADDLLSNVVNAEFFAMPRRSVHNAPFISFEGGEGAGKTTQVELLRQRLESLNLPVLVVREPGTTRLGEQVRDIIKSQSNNVPAADALLFMAARAQLMADIIVPELKKGTTVIGDRFSDSHHRLPRLMAGD